MASTTFHPRAFPTLHRYFMWSVLMKDRFEEALSEPEGRQGDGFAYLATKAGTFMSYWYGGLYVVVEGWRELGLSDPVIDPLLTSPNVEALRLFRNATFHYQHQWLHQKHRAFMQIEGSVSWVRQLHAAFSQYFLREMRARYRSHRDT